MSQDSQMAHLLHVSKLQSDLEYKKAFEDVKNQYHVSMDMVNLVHAKKAQDLATDRGYKTIMHRYTALPTDMKVEWAKQAYGLQSDVSPEVHYFYTTLHSFSHLELIIKNNFGSLIFGRFTDNNYHSLIILSPLTQWLYQRVRSLLNYNLIQYVIQYGRSAI